MQEGLGKADKIVLVLLALNDLRPARQITNFTSGLIWRHAWSRDGKYLALARGNLSIDAVMLTDIR